MTSDRFASANRCRCKRTIRLNEFKTYWDVVSVDVFSFRYSLHFHITYSGVLLFGPHCPVVFSHNTQSGSSVILCTFMCDVMLS